MGTTFHFTLEKMSQAGSSNGQFSCKKKGWGGCGTITITITTGAFCRGRRDPEGAQREPKGSEKEPKGANGSRQGGKRKPNRAQRRATGSQREPKGRQKGGKKGAKREPKRHV